MNDKHAKTLRRAAKSIARTEGVLPNQLVGGLKAGTLINEPSSERGVYRDLKRRHPTPESL